MTTLDKVFNEFEEKEKKELFHKKKEIKAIKKRKKKTDKVLLKKINNYLSPVFILLKGLENIKLDKIDVFEKKIGYKYGIFAEIQDIGWSKKHPNIKVKPKNLKIKQVPQVNGSEESKFIQITGGIRLEDAKEEIRSWKSNTAYGTSAGSETKLHHGQIKLISSLASIIISYKKSDTLRIVFNVMSPNTYEYTVETTKDGSHHYGLSFLGQYKAPYYDDDDYLPIYDKKSRSLYNPEKNENAKLNTYNYYGYSRHEALKSITKVFAQLVSDNKYKEKMTSLLKKVEEEAKLTPDIWENNL